MAVEVILMMASRGSSIGVGDGVDPDVRLPCQQSAFMIDPHRGESRQMSSGVDPGGKRAGSH